MWNTERAAHEDSHTLIRDRLEVRHIGPIIQRRQPISTDHTVDFRLGFLLNFGMEEQIEESEAQGLAGGLWTRHEHVHTDCQQLRFCDVEQI